MDSSAGIFVRREVRSLPPGDETLSHYAKAVKIMRERSERNPDDPTGWSYQASIHGSEESPLKELWDECKHGSWFFLPWHRMYVFYFEQIVRAAVVEAGGPEDWALPYWNYGLNGVNASIPDAFRNPTGPDGNENPLFVQQRRPGINEGGIIPPAVTTDAMAMSRPSFVGAPEFGGGEGPANQQFWSETGRLEQTPHNDIHNAVGGRGGWMANPDEAAKDPIFWLHHANIDRIWAEWNVNHDDPDQGGWPGQVFKFFDAGGTEAEKRCDEVVDTVKDLGYTYDNLPQIPPQPAAEGPAPAAQEPQEPAMTPNSPSDPKVVGANAGVTLTGSSEKIPVEVDERAKEEVEAATSETDPRRLYLNIEDIEGETNPGSVYGIYVNLPDDPSPEDLARHHAGNVSFFGIERARNPRKDEHSHSQRVSVDVGDLLRSISEGDSWKGGQVDVTLRPLGLISPGGEGPAAKAPPRARGLAPMDESQDDPPIQIGRVSLSVG